MPVHSNGSGSWRDLIESRIVRSLPWYGGSEVVDDEGRSWRVDGPRPREHGVYRFALIGRRAVLDDVEPVANWRWGLARDTSREVRGYLFGNVLIPDIAARLQLKELRDERRVYLIDQPAGRFFPVVCMTWCGELILLRFGFQSDVERDVQAAFYEKTDVDAVPGVSPALRTVFDLYSDLRRREEAARAEAERRRRLKELMRQGGTAVGRRELARVDFEAACREALRNAGAELVSVRPSLSPDEMIVVFRVDARRIECVVNRELACLDAGICLTDHETGESGDRLMTLESLPSVVREAGGRLVVYRHG